MTRRTPARDPDPDDRTGSGLPRMVYFCRSCRTKRRPTYTRTPPVGWLTLSAVRDPDAPGPSPGPYIRLGMYCSTACLAKALPHLRHGEPNARRPSAGAPTEGTTHD